MALMLRGLLLLALLALNAFFAAAENALLTVRRTRVEQLVREGKPHARLVQSLLSDVGLLISGTQLGLTVVSLLMGWQGETIMAGAIEQALEVSAHPYITAVVAHSVAVGLAFVLITILLMVLGELVPKAVAYERAEAVALFVARPMLSFLRLGRVLVFALDALAEFVLRLFGHPSGQGSSAQHTAEEVKLIVSGIRKGGMLAEQQEEMIHGVFDLHRVQVREIMVPIPKITCLHLTNDFNTLLEWIVEDQHSRIPIYEGLPDQIIGILYTKDLLRVVLDRRRRQVPPDSPLDLRSILHQPMIVPETMPVSRMLDDARRRHSQMAMVVDEFGTFVGLVTIEDVLEQIVGEIQDEYDQEEKVIHKLSDSVVLVDGALSVRDLANDYEIAVPRGAGYETLGGFVLAKLGVIPQGGESFVFEGRRYTVAETESRRIAKVKIEKLQSLTGKSAAGVTAPKRAGA
jgi:putative hemolysin